MPKTSLNTALIALFCLFFAPFYAQKNSDSTAQAQELIYDKSFKKPVNLVKTDLNRYKTDPAFNYFEAETPDNWWTQFNNWLNGLWNSFIQWVLNGKEAQGILKFLIQALPYIIILGIIIFLVWLFIKIDMRSTPLISNAPGKVHFTDEEQLIKHEDIQQLIDRAIANKNYRLAVRYYYLLMLQKLSNKELINWQAQKTNNDYILEIKDTSLRAQFTRLTRIYDFIWYGNFELDNSAFAKAEQEFQKIARAL